MSFSALSVCPLLLWWYADDCSCMMRFVLHQLVNSFQNCGMPSDRILTGFPCSKNQSSSDVVIAFVFNVLSGCTIGKPEYLLTPTR